MGTSTHQLSRYVGPRTDTSAMRNTSDTRAASLDVVQRVRAEYREMPGLRVNIKQAARLWQLDPSTCEALLNQLVTEGFLVRVGENYSRH